MPGRSIVSTTRTTALPSFFSRSRTPSGRKDATINFSAQTNSRHSSNNKSSMNYGSHSLLKSLQNINIALKEASLGSSVSKATVYRYSSFYSFNEDQALKAICQAYHQRYLHLTMTGDLLAQFQTRTLFPLTGLKTRDLKCNVLYMRPCRFVPEEMKTSNVIDNLCYVLNDLSQTKEECLNGVAFIANLEDWTMKNYSHDYCIQFMEALQGKMVPTKVELFLIVNPPRWFGRIWKVMKPMLSKSFSKKVHIIKEQRLGDFFMEGYEQYLPMEFESCGWRQTEEIVEDYIDMKQYENEQKLTKRSKFSSDCII
ncbi:unnamed protein product [Cylindrotheca closterium]|uniref:CRAL-TRIO domain-containing protein n=1 Tax=Cylindrotheca closterium TaxID=2856 RepID=A0AAD2GB17_9STRA|nr:unnamed protein product [Cylindrotheca closterium]